MKNVIISGADGFVGTHLTKRLLSEGVQVYAADLQLNGEGLPENVDAFYHFAWQGVASEYRNDFDSQYWNVDYSLRALRLAAGLGAKKFILPGSTFEYLYHNYPINKNAVPSPVNAYGSAKLAVRFLCESLAANLGIGFIYTVITSIYSADRRDGNVIFYTINELLNGRKPVLSSLEQKWDYVHIDDACEALYLIGKKGKPGKFYSIGHGDNIPLREYINKIRNIINPDLPLGIGEKADSDKITSSCIDLAELVGDTGFTPKISFDDGISEIIKKVQNEI